MTSPQAAPGPPSRRVVAAVAAVAVALAAVPLANTLLRAQPVHAGTNGIAPISLVAGVEPGQEACLAGLELPERAASLRVSTVGRGAPRGELLGTLSRAGGPPVAVRAAAEAETGSADAQFALPPGSPRAPAAATLCFTPSMPIDLVGKSGAADFGPPPTVAGSEVDARVAVRYPEAESHALLARLPTVLERALRFKPGGAWLGWAALLAGLATSAAAVALVLRAGRLRPRALAGAIALVALVQASGFALLTPAFDGPDEADHFAYAESIARSGHVSDAEPGERPPYSDRHGQLLTTLRHSARVGTPLGKAIYTARDEADWEERSRGLRADNGGGHTVPTRIHSPAYYGLLAPGYALGGAVGGEAGSLVGARLVSALALLVIALCAFAIVRELAPRRPELAAAAGLLVALQPQLGFMSGVVNNDAGVNAAGAVAIWLAVRAARRPPDPRRYAAAGAALALAVLFKATAFSLAAALAVAVLAALARHGRAALPAAAAALTAYAVPLAAWLLVAPEVGRGNVTGELGGQLLFSAVAIAAVALLAIPIRRGPRAVLATAAGLGLAALVVLASGGGPAAGAVDSAKATASYVWQIFLPRPPFMDDHWAQGWPQTFVDVYVRQTFGGYGQLAHVIPLRRLVAVLAGALAVAAAAAWTWRRRRADVRRRGWELALLVVAPVAVVLGVEHAYTSEGIRAVPAEQGRYLFPAAAAVAALAALAAAGLRPATARLAGAIAVAVMGLLALDGRLFYLAGAYL